MAETERAQDPPPELTTGVSHREIRDPQVLRALAHPVRLRILEELAQVGSATATELSEQIGESAANCSWHLRQLARYGFVEEADGGTGRRRPWRLVAQSTRIPPPEQEQGDQEFTHAGDELLSVLLGREVEAFRAWQAARRQAPRAWREASFASQSWDYLTAEELAEFRRELSALIDRVFLARADRADPARRPPEARLVRFAAWAIPAGPPSALPGHDGR
jgi:DNA-binding transcriptional ArsR family regulator